jgi:hypothetical protein
MNEDEVQQLSLLIQSYKDQLDRLHVEKGDTEEMKEYVLKNLMLLNEKKIDNYLINN